jgi:hypothetical protein
MVTTITNSSVTVVDSFRIAARSATFSIATALAVRTGTFLWAPGAHPQKCPKYNAYSYNRLAAAITQQLEKKAVIYYT